MGASATTVCPPAWIAPVCTSRQSSPAGRYTLRFVAPASNTGATSRSGPNRYSSS